jgi:ribosome recycling factor
MDVNDLKTLNAEVKKRMTAVIEHLRHDLAGVRTGRASTGMLDPVHVEAYGTRVPLNQVASLSVPEPSMIVAQPFDPTLMGAIEKAIRASDLGLNPNNDGKVIRIPVPALTDERRKELSRHVHKMAEESRNTVRVVRREANDRLRVALDSMRAALAPMLDQAQRDRLTREVSRMPPFGPGRGRGGAPPLGRGAPPPGAGRGPPN